MPKCCAKGRVGSIIGVEILYVCHLDDEEDKSIIAFLYGSGQTIQMFRAPLRGGIGKSANAIVFQSHALDLQKALAAIPGKRKIKTGISVSIFRFQIRDLPQTTG